MQMLKNRCHSCSETYVSFSEEPTLSLPERLRCRKCKFLNLGKRLKPFDPCQRLKMRRKDRFIKLSKIISRLFFIVNMYNGNILTN